MHHSVVSARYCSGYRIEVRFEDGTSGTVDFTRFVRRGGVFAKLRDVEVFKRFAINPDFGVICWGDVDIAPETVYAEAQRRRRAKKLPAPVAVVAESPGTYRTNPRQ